MTKQDPEGQGRQFQQFVANIGNDVNYDLAFSTAKNRYVATIAREREPNEALDKPCVHIARGQGALITNLSEPMIDQNLGDQVECSLFFAQRDAHNDGFLRDEYGYLADMAGHAGGETFAWVYYSTSDTNIVTDANINRTPFRLQ